MRLLIDASNVTAAGPVALGRALLPRLVARRGDASVTVLVPDGSPLADGLPPGAVERVARATGIGNDLRRLAHTLVALPRRLRREHIDVCLTLGDVGPIATGAAHVMFVHQGHLARAADELAEVPDRGWLKERYLAAHVGASARRAARVIVQTPVMAERFARRHGVDAERIAVISQPPPPGFGNGGRPPAALADPAAPLRLLVLAAWYPHKNHAVLAPLAGELRRRGLGDRVRIVVTLPEAIWASAPLAAVRAAAPLVVNAGPIAAGDVGASLRASSALLLPTLMESYGMPYVEALATNTPILTSDRDFARWACGDLAGYFDPRDPASIADAIAGLDRDGPPPDYASRAEARLRQLPPDWDAVADAFARVIDEAARR